jgi:hypothetical protein
MNLLWSRVPGNMSPKQEQQNEKEIFFIMFWFLIDYSH